MVDRFTYLPEQFIVYAARHGKPEQRPEIRYDIPPGPQLSERGREEAAELGRFLRGQAVLAEMQASPLERTLGTAQIAGGICGLDFAVDPDLAEWRADETEELLSKRVERAFRRAAERSQQLAAPVAVVTHGGPILMVLKGLGVPKASLDRVRIYDTNPISTAGVWRVERTNGHVKVELAFVPTGHRLPPEDARCYILPVEEKI